MIRILSLLLILIGCIASSTLAQKTVEGVVTDARTGETLPSTSILIEDTYRGTITNRDGRYSLTIPDSLLPATLRFRFLGYATKRLVIDRNTSEQQDVALESAPLEMEGLVVTDEDPAIRVMREVIRRKQNWREKLHTYRAAAYTRQTLSNDTSIVMISESASTAFWDHERGHREVVQAQRNTANLGEGQNLSGVSYIPSFYDDNIEIAGFSVVGVTHPDALEYYDFEIVNHTAIGEQMVYEIEVTPARPLQPLFEGTIHVLDGEYALLDVRLAPNDVVAFPPPVRTFQMDYGQQFENFGGDFWLPVDMRIEGEVKISMIGLEFPLIRFRQVARITDYGVNVDLPDSLYEEERTFTVDTTSVVRDSLAKRDLDVVPLSLDEERAYASLDSTQTLEEAFQPTGFLARMLDLRISAGDETDDRPAGTETDEAGGVGIPGSLRPDPRFNRVDEFYLGAKYRIPLFRRLQADISGGYSTGFDTWGYGGGLEYTFRPADGFRQEIGVRYTSNTVTRFTSDVFDPVMTLVPNLLGFRDYFDYYRTEGVELSTLLRQYQRDLSLELGFRSQHHRSLTVNTAWDLLGRDNTVRPNPLIDEGRMRSVYAEAGYNLDEEYTFGITGMRRIRAGVEYSGGGLNSDFDFMRFNGRIDWNFATFYRRRFLPNTLDLTLVGGTHTGELPLQRMGTVDGAIGALSPFGTLKTIRNRPYEGEHYVGLSAEHNFRTVPFELLGIRKLVELNWSIIAFGGAARTWIPESRMQELQSEYGYTPLVTDPVHYEAGLSVNGILGLFRIDFAQRLDRPAFLISASVARYF